MINTNTPFDWAQMTIELERDEGTRLKVYDDATGRDIVPGSTCIGHPTIGIGRALDVNGISVGEADDLVLSDLRRYWVELSRMPWFALLDPIRQRAIMNMRHQIGLDGLLGFSMMIDALATCDYAKAAARGLESRWATQTPDRARRVLAMLLTGQAPQRGSVGA
jgi:lysozyme